jgi:hypothetical protein
MRIASAGNVGIGTTGPEKKLHVVDTSAGVTTTPLLVMNRGNAASTAAQIALIATGSDFADGQYAAIKAYSSQGTGNSSHDLAFLTCTTGGTPTDRLYITRTGNVGIGTTSPRNTLDVNGGVILASGSNLTWGNIYGAGIPTIVGSSGTLQFYPNGSTSGESARIDSSGRLLVGTSTTSGNATVHINKGVSSGADGGGLLISNIGAMVGVGVNDVLGYVNFGASGSTFTSYDTTRILCQADATWASGSYPSRLVFSTTASGAATPTERMRITQAGTTTLTSAASTAPFVANISASEVARIDTSGRFLVGTSTSGSVQTKTIELHNEGTSTAQPAYQVYSYPGATPTNAGYFDFYKSRGSTIGTRTIVANNDTLGYIRWAGANGTGYNIAAQIIGEVDGTPGASSDMPGRILFSTTADGSSLPTERMRITSDGALGLGVTPTLNYSDAIGVQLYGDATNGGIGFFNTNNKTCIFTNRKATDGDLISFAQDGTVEGTISVSGTTVSYNGAHLSRWSQLPSGTERIEILRGSVLANIDEMCKWNEEDNEQLNRMKVSDVEGDKNVSGVFQDWDDDDDTYINDFYCAMTGDFIIRIAEGVTVERGDLLMSAGDGTAKSQDDDIIRSNTVAKVTSTHVTCTYDDGSYCVPCVLMAC